MHVHVCGSVLKVCICVCAICDQASKHPHGGLGLGGRASSALEASSGLWRAQPRVAPLPVAGAGAASRAQGWPPGLHPVLEGVSNLPAVPPEAPSSLKLGKAPLWPGPWLMKLGTLAPRVPPCLSYFSNMQPTATAQ